MILAHGAVQNRSRLCKFKFPCKRKCTFECKRNLKWFLLPFYKNMLPARAGNTFLKTNFEQSAFKNPLFGILKASNEDSLGHLWGTYGSQTFFFRRFSASVAHPNFEKSAAKRITFAHGAAPNQFRPCKCKFQCKRKCKIRMQTQFEVIFASVLQKYAPRSSGKHFFENQLCAIGLQKFPFWSTEGLK